MATYYVRPDGNDGNAGTGSSTAQAWATLGKALGATGITGGDTLYIAPGRYAQQITLGGTYSSATDVTGDPLCNQFSGLTAGKVFITNVSSAGVSNFTGVLLSGSGKSNLTFTNIAFENNANTTAGRCVDLLLGTNNRFVKCTFRHSGYGAPLMSITCPTSTALNATLDRCIFGGGQVTYSGTAMVALTGSNVSDTTSVKNCIFYSGQTGAFLALVSLGASIYNCSFINHPSLAVNVASGSATYVTYVRNCLFVGVQTSVQAGTLGHLIQEYNRLGQSGIFNVATSVTSTTGGNAGIDDGYSLLVGLGATSIHASELGSPNTSFGTASGAPVTDIYGFAWSGTSPDAGASTYKLLSTINPTYNPTERNASTITIAPASTSQSIELYLGATGLTASTSGLTARYNRTRTASVSIPLVARTIAQAWTSGGFAEVDATNMPGVYRLDLPDAALAAGADDVTIVVRGASGTNGAVMTVKLSSGGLTEAQTASAVWGASPAGYNDGTTFGGVVNQIDQTATGIDTQVQDVAGNVWDELKANHTIPNSFGDYLDTKVSTGADTSRIQLRQGPFLIKQNAIDSVITEVNQFLSTVPNIEMVLIDSSGGSVSVAGATLVMRVRNQAGTAVVNNVTPTVAYADGGVIRWSPNLSWNALGVTTAGTYRIVVERTMSSVTTTFGPFLVQLSSG
jgi:hypothetical protein